MKKIKNIFLCLLTVLLFMASPGVAMAAEIIEDPYVTITFTAHVPEGFNQDIILKITNQSTDIIQTLGLAESVEYTRPIMVLRDSTYIIEPIIENGDYITDLDESYVFASEQTVDFNVLENTGEQQESEDTNVMESSENGASEIPNPEESGIEIDELTGLESANSVFERFISVCSVMEDNPDYQDYIHIYSAQLIKQEYLKDKETNTEETWDAMTLAEKYILHMSYTLPKLYLFKGMDNEKDFLENVESHLRGLEDIEGGDIIREEVLSLWRWHYKYYLHTGMFYDFYADYQGEYVGTPLDESKSEMDEIREAVSDSGMEDEIQEIIEEENLHPEEKENGVIAWIKNNIITLSILVIVGIAFVVTAVLVRHKNMRDPE